MSSGSDRAFGMGVSARAGVPSLILPFVACPELFPKRQDPVSSNASTPVWASNLPSDQHKAGLSATEEYDFMSLGSNISTCKRACCHKHSHIRTRISKEFERCLSRLSCSPPAAKGSKTPQSCHRRICSDMTCSLKVTLDVFRCAGKLAKQPARVPRSCGPALQNSREPASWTRGVIAGVEEFLPEAALGKYLRREEKRPQNQKAGAKNDELDQVPEHA